jgi:amino acid adenylation domain-containing protein
VTDLDARLAALSPEKRALFEKMLREQGRSRQGRTENTFPISVMQQGIWFLEQLKPHNPAYVIPAAVRIRGRLETPVLADAMNEVVRRHEVLRTVFEPRDGKPTQIVRPRLVLDIPETDLRGRPQDEVDRAVSETFTEPFDLATGPLLRWRLLRTGADEYVLALAMHHLVSDGWSMKILLSELSTLYAAFTAGRPSPLPELTIQYGDFAAWQQQWLRRESLEDALAHWRRHLAGAPAVLGLATDRPRPAVQGFNGASHPFALPEPVMRALTAVGKERGATTYMALLAVFHVLLHRYSNQDDVVVGVPMANRGRAEVEPLIGFFVNTLPVRADLSGNPDFLTVVERVRDACLGAYTHERVPFEKVVEDLKPARDLSRPPIFQVGLSYQSDPLPTLAVAGVEFTRLPVPIQGARFDLELQFFEEAGGLTGWFEYDRDLFDAPTVARMAEHFGRLVESVVAEPDAPVDELPMLGDEEFRQVMAWSRGPEQEWPEHGLVHECFERRARLDPTAQAVRFEGRSLTYGELNRLANQLARRLRRLGVGRDVLVAVAMERSLELVVGLLAVLKAGGAYVPLDPGYPQARLEYMLQDAEPPVVLTQRHVLERLPAVKGEALCLEELADALAEEPADDLDIAVNGEDRAYVIHTSGSTGEPKGVMNRHAGIRNRLLWMQDRYGLGPGDRVLQKTPFSFDVSVWEFFWPLMTGATLVVARPGGHRDSGYLLETIRAESVTTLHFVPSMLQVFLQEPGVEECASLRRVFCSGEALPRELQERFAARCPAELHNLYGPTEAAVDVTHWECRRDGDPRPVPIGEPIANTQVYVLDRYLQPVPAGVPGELHIGGRNLARGYLNRPELTAERFVPNPFEADPAARMYKTGDLVRHRADGMVEYLGRIDHQVKVRGFRIELGEIEAVLCRHDRVREAVVVAREQATGDVRLVAYLTADGEPAAADLAAHLRERLPEYMVPAVFAVLPALPLTPNGKVDRAALPEPDPGRPELATPFVAPRDGLEHSLAEMWRDLLGVERVGAHDNFFDLGGHSLRMSELRARLATTLGLEVSMVELFQNPTVGSLAAYLDRPSGAEPALAAQDRAESRRRSQDQRRQAAARRSRSRNSR